MATGTSQQVGPRQFCSECGRAFPPEDLATFGNISVCSDCKPSYVQRVREGAVTANQTFVYGGFWQRFAAIFIDGLIVLVVLAPFVGAAVYFGDVFSVTGPRDAGKLGIFALVELFLICIPLAYHVYFLHKKGATPGKSALGLKVVTAAGGPISIGRAIGRYFAYTLSYLPLYIGFIMAGFDEEKRALHDRICGTRVIVTRS
jgi:uncharacterized RDD family membrane protein YckC